MGNVLAFPRPTCEKVAFPCVKDGQPAAREMTFVWQAGDQDLMPRLFIFSEWSTRKSGWRQQDKYSLEESPTGMKGRAFMLYRSAEAVAKDLEGDHYCSVFIARNRQDHICECKGYTPRGYCKHVAAVRWAIECGHLDEQPASAPRRHIRLCVPTDGDVSFVEILPGERGVFTLYARHQDGRRFAFMVAAGDGAEAMRKFKDTIDAEVADAADCDIANGHLDVDFIVAWQHDEAYRREAQLLKDMDARRWEDLEIPSLEELGLNDPLPIRLMNNRPADLTSCPF